MLLIDDDELIQSSMQAILEALGHTVSPLATTARRPWSSSKPGSSPDVVILDMNMPGLGGAGTLPRLRAPAPERCPCCSPRAEPTRRALDLATAHPGVTLLAKPFGLRDLQHQLEALGLA